MMTQPTNISSGYSIQRKDHLVHIINHHTSSLQVMVFVFSLVSVILLINGIIFSVLGILQEDFSIFAGIIPTIIGTISISTTIKIRGLIRKRHAAPIEECTTLVIMDTLEKTLCDSSGNVLAPLSEVSLKKKFQISSSSPAYALVWKDGEQIVIRGNIFAGGTAGFIGELKRYGLSVS